MTTSPPGPSPADPPGTDSSRPGTAAGYDPGFLAVSVPLPVPGDGRVVRELASTHFTVLLDPARRLAAGTGVNIDGSALVDVDRDDDWHLDPRVPAGEQAGEELYSGNDLDRGHLVRRRDPVWGEPEVADQANTDTFTYTNAAPQAADFNQDTDLWLGLEDYLLEYAQATSSRLSVFTGPVLADDDPVYRGVAIPRLFWKIAAWTTTTTTTTGTDDDGGDASEGGAVLAATAYTLDQSPQLDDITRDEQTARALLAGDPPPLGPYRTFQVPVADVATLTGLDLGPLADADQLDAAPSASPLLAPGRTQHPGTWRQLGPEVGPVLR